MTTTGDGSATARSGDLAGFAALLRRHRAGLRAHCYRMLGSYGQAEDVVQEAVLHAVSAHTAEPVPDRLYRLATLACLRLLDGRDRRVLPPHLSAPATADADLVARRDIAWLRPYPDRLRGDDRSGIALAYTAALQQLPPRQRAVLLLADLGWPVPRIAAALDATGQVVTHHLRHARTLLGGAAGRAGEPRGSHQELLRRYADAVESGDLHAATALLAPDVRISMPPHLVWYQGRETLRAVAAAAWDPASPRYAGTFRLVATGANGQPAAGVYRCPPGGRAHTAYAVAVFTVAGGAIAEITSFHDPELFTWFDLPQQV
ncbi:RNA polymerase subunit sigma-70 [Catellatospora sp. TT07R-123]|uniref:RNA polymerase subunit sigma-70 n=1 Tax=Catellatospora sp. TT07R-123 TaxID=2733863 RepID=UPI001BB3F01F|nr:RNA polymerase subunit sigma-70 [Catellatospora sp. TT07R-123]